MSPSPPPKRKNTSKRQNTHPVLMIARSSSSPFQLIYPPCLSRAPERPSVASSRSQLHLNTKKTTRPSKISSWEVRHNSGVAIAAAADRGTDKGIDSDPVHQVRQLKLVWEEACPAGLCNTTNIHITNTMPGRHCGDSKKEGRNSFQFREAHKWKFRGEVTLTGWKGWRLESRVSGIWRLARLGCVVP